MPSAVAPPTPSRAVTCSLEARGLTVRFGRRRVLQGCTLAVAPGTMTALLGRDGAGKSTLLRCLSGVLAPRDGSVLLEGRPLRQFRRHEIARIIAVVPQDVTMPFSFTVREMVGLGRTPYIPVLAGPTHHDDAVVEETVTRLGLRDLAAQRFEDLSAGERQRVVLAMALAQQPRLLLLDEPTAHLDVAHQLEALALLRVLHAEGLTVLATMHDLNLAALAFDRLLLLHDGRVIAAGTPREVLTEQTIWTVYGTQARITTHPTRDVPQVTLIP
ncbi:MAG: ABC transporter ATP-binding protein [Chloroflexota bacterium]